MQLSKTLKFCLVGGSLFAAPFSAIQGQNLSDLQNTQHAKLEAAIQELAQQRKEIQSQQIPLAQELRNLEQEAKELRRQHREARKARDSRSVDLETLKQAVRSQQQAYNYITRTLFSEYSSSYESSLSAGELATYGKSVRDLNLQLENPQLSETEQLQAMLDLIVESTERIESTIGGKYYEGEALDTEGRLIDGAFIQVGPLLYFSSDSASGVIAESKTFQARVRSINSSADKLVKEIASTKSGELPIDPSLGNALAMQSTKDSVWEHIKKGGIWVYPIILFAFVATVIAIFKFIQIMKIRQPAPQVVHDIVKLLREGKQTEARKLAQSQPAPARDMFIRAVEHADESIELVEEAMYESMLHTQPALERYLNIIAVTASVAPLLGLLGTVTGIIKTFNLMRVFGAGDPKPLISGISEALITTELGLVLAIPALLIHALLSRKVAGAMAHCEKLSVAFINSISRRESPK
ncbi:MAG: MotA/TolQ/ExbB proton channel family protein [Lentimonas sp.]